jgi:hypothetical protein
MMIWGGRGPVPQNTGGRYCAEPPPPLTVIEPNGDEVWTMGSVDEIRWKGGNLKNSDRLIIQYSRTGELPGSGLRRTCRHYRSVIRGKWTITPLFKAG